MRKWLLKQFEWYRGLILRLKTRRGFLFYKDKDMQLYEKYVTETVDEKTGRLTKIDFHIPDDFNFGFDVVDFWGKNTPDKTALLWVGEHHEEKTFTFSDMMRLTNKTANYFRSLGIKKGDRVMLILRRHYQFWFSIVALHKIGAIVIPATDQLMKKDLVYRFNLAGVSAVVISSTGSIVDEAEKAFEQCDVKTKILVGASREGWHDFDAEFQAFSDEFKRGEGVDATYKNDAALMFFTSGTSGYPKLVMHDHAYAIGHFITAKWWHNIDGNGVHLTIADTGWGKAVWGKLYGQWLMGNCVFVYDFTRFNADDMLSVIEKHKITTFCAPPTIFRFLIKEDLSKYDISSIKYATIAGEALNPEVYKQFLSLTGIKLMEGFGQTETTLTLANLLHMNPKPGSMGMPSPQYKIKLITADGRLAANGEEGEICVDISEGAPVGLFRGYYNNEEATKAVMHDGLYHTGDTAWRDEDGYYWFVGRTDDIIKSSGYRIGPFEIESVLMEHPAVLECAITGAPDPVRGQVVKATIVLAKGYTPSEELKKEIQQYVKRLTAPYKYPRIVEFVTELPKTISGKIRHSEIRKQDNQ